METAKDKGVVVPGEIIGTIEEGEPGEGTYEERGDVRAMFVGKGLFDPKNKLFVVSLLPSGPSIPREGEEVIARAIVVQNSLATLEIMKTSDRTLGRTFTGLLYHARAGKGVRSRLKKYIKPGDVVRAKVVYDKNLIHVAMMGDRFGVILAYCSRCGGTLEKRGARNYLYCRSCGWRETRLTASDYGALKW